MTETKSLTQKICPLYRAEARCSLCSKWVVLSVDTITAFCHGDYMRCIDYRNSRASTKLSEVDQEHFDGQNSPGLGGCLMLDESEPFPYTFDGQNL